MTGDGPGPTADLVVTDSAEATEDLGETLAGELRPGDVVLLEGDLAAGKTTLVRGLVRGLGGEDTDVASPTFVLHHEYPCRGRGVDRVPHVDLYRLSENVSDLREIGIEDILSDANAVIAVEWPKDVLATWLPADARVWRVSLESGDDGSRRIEIVHPTTS